VELDSMAWAEIVIATALFAVGGLVGWIAARGGQGARARARRLEAELRQTEERLASYEDQVAKHFAQTSDLFGDLTRQYTAVWDHLAEGARDLCAERVAALGQGFAGPPLLLTKAPTGEAPPPAAEIRSETDPAPESLDPMPEGEDPTRAG